MAVPWFSPLERSTPNARHLPLVFGCASENQNQLRTPKTATSLGVDLQFLPKPIPSACAKTHMLTRWIVYTYPGRDTTGGFSPGRVPYPLFHICRVAVARNSLPGGGCLIPGTGRTPPSRLPLAATRQKGKFNTLFGGKTFSVYVVARQKQKAPSLH